MRMAVVSKVFSIVFSILFIVQQVAWSAPGTFSPAASTPMQTGVMVDKLLGYRPSIYMTGIEITKDGELRFAWEKVREKEGTIISDKEKEMNLKYFLSALALPDDNFWVNLNVTAEEGEILGAGLKFLDMGKVFLAADVELKRDVKRAFEQTGLLEELFERSAQYIGADKDWAFRPRFWIVPKGIEIEENDGMMHIKSCRLTVKVEVRQSREAKKGGDRFKKYAEEEIKQRILPLLTKAVNTDEKYMPLRQAVHAIAVARWYEKHAPNLNGRFAKIIDSGAIGGLKAAPWSKRAFLEEYLRLYNLGEMDTMGDGWYVAGGGADITGAVIDGATRPEEVGPDADLEKIASSKENITVDELKEGNQGKRDLGPNVGNEDGWTNLQILLGIVVMLMAIPALNSSLTLSYVLAGVGAFIALSGVLLELFFVIYKNLLRKEIYKAIDDELVPLGMTGLEKIKMKQMKQMKQYINYRIENLKLYPFKPYEEIPTIVRDAMEEVNPLPDINGGRTHREQLVANIMARIFFNSKKSAIKNAKNINKVLSNAGFKDVQRAIAIANAISDKVMGYKTKIKRILKAEGFSAKDINSAIEWVKERENKIDDLEEFKENGLLLDDKGITTITFLGVILLLSGGIVFSDVLLGKLGFVIGAMFGGRAVKARFADVVFKLYSKFRQESLKIALNEELSLFGVDDEQKKRIMNYINLRLQEVKGLTNPKDVDRAIATITQESIEQNLLTENKTGTRRLTANIMARLFSTTSEDIGKEVIKINNKLKELGFKPSEIAIAVLRSAMDPNASKEENVRRLDAVLDSDEFRAIFTGNAINAAREWLRERKEKESQSLQSLRIDNPLSKAGTAKVKGIQGLSYGSWRIITENKVLIGGELETDNELSKLFARDNVLAPVRDAYQGLAQALYEDIFGDDAVESRKAKVLLFDRDGENLFGFTTKVDGQRIVGIEWLLAQLAKPVGYDSSYARALASLVMHELVEAELEGAKLELTRDGEGIIINIDGKDDLADKLNVLLKSLTDPAAISLYKMAVNKLKEGDKESQEKARHYISVAIVSEMMPDANRELTAYIYTSIGKRLGEFLEKTLLVEGIDEGVFGVFAEGYKGVIKFIRDMEEEDKGFTLESMELINEFYSAISEGTTDAILQFVQENIADLSRDTGNVKRFKADVDKIAGYYKSGDIDKKGAAFLVIDAIFRHNIMPAGPDRDSMVENRDGLARSIPWFLAKIALDADIYLPGMQLDYAAVERLMSVRAGLIRAQSDVKEDIHPNKTGGIDLSMIRLVPVSLGRI